MMSGIFGAIERPLDKPKSYAQMSNKDLLRLYRDSCFLHLNPDRRKYWEGYYVISQDALNLIAETIIDRMKRGYTDDADIVG